MWPKCWRRASCCASALKSWESSTSRAQANFVLIRAGDSAPSKFATNCAIAASWCATAATKLPGCVRITVGTREQMRPLPEGTGEIWLKRSLIVFDMDGVLVDVTESYRETIVRRSSILPAPPITHDRFRTTRITVA